MRWTNWIKSSALVLAVLVLAACGDGGSAEPTVAVPEVVEPAVPEPSEAPVEATPASVELGQGFWFAGFHVELGTATYDPSNGLVTIAATFENLGSEPAVFDGTPSLAAGGSFYETSATHSLPTVPGLGTGAGELVFDVDEAFTFPGAVLTIGLADNNQAVVPFDTTGEPVTLEPIPFDVSGNASAGAIAVDLTTPSCARTSPRSTARSRRAPRPSRSGST